MRCNARSLDTEKTHDESVIRKVYFKLANKYHPDKNPDGREMFEKCVRRAPRECVGVDPTVPILTSPCTLRPCRINKAYEFLVATGKTMTSGPDPQRIILLLRAQVRLRCPAAGPWVRPILVSRGSVGGPCRRCRRSCSRATPTS